MKMTLILRGDVATTEYLIFNAPKVFSKFWKSNCERVNFK